LRNDAGRAAAEAILDLLPAGRAPTT